jgi:hypothetical protein
MKVFKDLISGDEMFSDSYPHQLIYQDAIYEVKSKYVTKGSDNICIASDDVNEDDGEGETVVDLVDSFGLLEMNLSKKDFMGYVKDFLKANVKMMKEDGREDRVKAFQAGATEAVKFIVSKIGEFQFFMG